MKYFFPCLLTKMVVLVCSCSNNSANSIAGNSANQYQHPNEKAVSGITDNQISFKVNNTAITSTGWNIGRTVMNDQLVLNVTSNMHEEPRTINLNINGDKAGKYRFLKEGAYNKPGYAYGSYFSNYPAEMATPWYFEDGEFIITTIDTIRGILDASFSAIVRSGKGETLLITDGKIVRGKLRPGITQY